MDIKTFYQLVENNLSKGGYSLFDKLKLANSDLVGAVINSDPMAVAESLNAWVNPNKPDGLERLPLPLAVDNNNEMIVGMLLLKKANPDVRGKDGESALYKAVFWENENIVRLLLDKGASPTFSNLDGRTPIDAAKESGDKNILALLTNDEVGLKRMQLEKDQATHRAMKARAQKMKAAKLNKEVSVEAPTLDKGKAEMPSDQETAIADRYVSAKSPLSALIQAVKAKDSQAVKFFAPKVEDMNANIKGETPLQLAILGGKEKLAIFLCDHGANLFIKDAEGNYPLLNYSIQHQLYDLLNVALSKSETVQEILNDNSQSFSAQFLAYTDPKMMNLLIRHGADPFFGGKDAISPILKAIQKGSIAILPVLAKYNTPFDKKIDGKSILNWAVELERIDWVNGLLTENALANAGEKDINILSVAAKATNNQILMSIIASINV